MKYLIGIICIALLAGPAVQPVENLVKPTIDIQGYYTVEENQGVVQVYRVKEIYRVDCMFRGGDMAHGIGMLDGNFLTVSWRTLGGAFGITRYEIQMKNDKLTLVGRWAGIPGDGQIREETLYFFKSLK